MKEKINISKQALMRFASKVHNKQIISDKSFEEWKKSNEDKLENLERAKEAEANFEEDHFYIKENLNRELEVVLAEMDLLNSKVNYSHL